MSSIICNIVLLSERWPTFLLIIGTQGFFCLHQEDMARCVFMSMNPAFYAGCSLKCTDLSVSSFQRQFFLLTVSFPFLIYSFSPLGTPFIVG